MTPESGAEKRYFSKSEKTIKVCKKSEAEEGGVIRGGGRGKRSGQKKETMEPFGGSKQKRQKSKFTARIITSE